MSDKNDHKPIALGDAGLSPRIPLVIDSPHCGTRYADDFSYNCALADLRQAEDTHVGALVHAGANAVGAGFLRARFPRSYVDVNRYQRDLDMRQFTGSWPRDFFETDKPSRYARLGKGVVWTRLRDSKTPIYDEPPSHKAVLKRLKRCYFPYHEALGKMLDYAKQAHGAVWHLNMHSMGSDAMRLDGKPNPDLAEIVIGDRGGRTSDPAFRDCIAGLFRKRGYEVAINTPFKGVEILRRYGEPDADCHALQIEIRRDLYMDEATREPHVGYSQLMRDLDAVIAGAAEFALAHAPDAASGIKGGKDPSSAPPSL